MVTMAKKLEVEEPLIGYTSEVTITIWWLCCWYSSRKRAKTPCARRNGPGFHPLGRKTTFTYVTRYLLCPGSQPVGAGLDVFDGRPKLSAWRDRVRAAIGAELFDEAHQRILSAQEMAQSMDGSKLQHFKARILKMFLWEKKMQAYECRFTRAWSCNLNLTLTESYAKHNQ